MEKNTFHIDDIKAPEYNHTYLEAKKCPKCLSVFISATGCDSCNYQFGFDYLGETLGEKSFYTIREKYWNNLGLFSKTYSFIEKKGLFYNNFKRACLHRLDLLLRFFSEPNSQTHKDFPIYFKEFKDLVTQLLELGVEESYLWSGVDSALEETALLKGSIYQQIALCLEDARSIKKTLDRPILQRFMNYRIAGTLRLGVLLLFLVMTSIISLLCVSFFKYLTL